MLLVGNVFALAGCLVMVFIGLIREKKKILLAQSLQFALMGVGNLLLGGVTGFIANLVSLARNLLFARKKGDMRVWKIVFIAAQLLLSLSVMGNGWRDWFSWLPVFAAALFTWFLDTKSEITLKIIIMITQLLWLVYDLHIQNYVTVAFDIFTFLSTAAGICLILRARREKIEEIEEEKPR